MLVLTRVSHTNSGVVGDRGGGFPPREDLPLPTSPPYTAFVGNMAFDLTEQDLEAFFEGLSVRPFHALTPNRTRIAKIRLNLAGKERESDQGPR